MGAEQIVVFPNSRFYGSDSVNNFTLSQYVASGNDIMSCNEFHKSLVVYRFRNVMAFIITLRKRWQFLDFGTPKRDY